MANKNSPSFKYSDDELTRLIDQADAENRQKLSQPVSIAGGYDDGSVTLSSKTTPEPDSRKLNKETKGPKPLSSAAKREQKTAGNIVSDVVSSSEDYDNTIAGVGESKKASGLLDGINFAADGSDPEVGRQPYYQAGAVDPVAGQAKPSLAFSPEMGEIKGGAASGVLPQAKAGQQVLAGTGPLFAPAGGSKVGLSGMLSSGKVGRNALAGAAVGAVLGGLNPAGDDGLFGGAMGGGVVGAAMGGLAGAVNAHMNPKGSETISKGGKLFPGPMKDGAPTKGGRAGMLMSVGGVVGGVMGGLIGGSGKGKRHNTIDSNGWSKGTHPAYF